jgi:transposase
MPKLSASITANIMIDLKAGMSTRQISSKYSVPQTSVSRIAQNIKEDIPPPRRGRPSNITKNTRCEIVRDITSGRLKNTIQVKDKLSKEYKIEISPNRIREILREEGLSAEKKKKKPFLGPKHRKQRMDFVHMYENWTIDDWKRVIFSDETRINRFCGDGGAWVWKNPRAINQNNLYDETLKYGGGHLMM